MVRGNSGYSNLGKVSPGKAQETEKKNRNLTMWVLRYMGSNKCTKQYIMVWLGIFELAVGMVRGNSG